jgi:hypothetical protein
MIPWNKTTALVTGLALIILGNGVALTGIYYNRSGEPDARVTLTQRELRLPYYGGFVSENSGVAFNLQWRIRDDNSNYATNWGYPDWLDEKKLKELGFNTKIPKEAPHATRRYRKMLPRAAYVVLEYNGPTYKANLARVLNNLKTQKQLATEHPSDKQHAVDLRQAETAVDNEKNTFSHLFAVDTGVNKGVLRHKYPNRSMYIIAEAQIRIALFAPKPPSPLKLAGRIQSLSINSITAPYTIRQQLEPHLTKNRYAARHNLKYNVTIAYGRRLEPWIEDLIIIQSDNK